MMKIFYVIKWTLGSLLFLLLLDLVVESAVVAPNQKGNQDGTKLPEQRFLPEISPALYVEEENLAPELTQISRKRVKRRASSYLLSSARNQKGNQDGTKLSEQRFLPETSPALYVVEENHAPKLNQISRKRVKRQALKPKRIPQSFLCGKTKNYKGVKTTIWLTKLPTSDCFLDTCTIDSLWMVNCKNEVTIRCSRITTQKRAAVCARFYSTLLKF